MSNRLDKKMSSRGDVVCVQDVAEKEISTKCVVVIVAYEAVKVGSVFIVKKNKNGQD